MDITKLLDLENDGINMVVDGKFLYIRCKRDMYKYNLCDMNMAARNTIFKKDGKARGFSVCDKYIFLTDFCDLYILDKEHLGVIETIRIGKDLSSDIGMVRFCDEKAYIGVRNGKMAVTDVDLRKIVTYCVCNVSFWDFCIANNYIYAGTVHGELLEIDTRDMQIKRITQPHKKNVYSVIHDNGHIYTVSQDMSVRALDTTTFEIIATTKKAVGGMARLLGVYGDVLIASDSGKITMWDKHTLHLTESFAFPTGSYNKGVVLSENLLIGSDCQRIYSSQLERI